MSETRQQLGLRQTLGDARNSGTAQPMPLAPAAPVDSRKHKRGTVRTRAAVGIAALAFFALIGVACSSSSTSSEASESPDQILQDAKAATTSASSVHVHGQIEGSNTGNVTLDIVVSHGAGGGTISEGGSEFQVIVIDNRVYVMADQGTLQRLTGNAAASQLIAGRWLETTTSNADFRDISQLTNLTALVQQISPRGTISKGQVTTVNGESAVPLSDSSGGGSVYVATNGPSYILQVKGGSGSSGSRGTIVFDEYNKAVPPVAPANPVNLDQLANS